MGSAATVINVPQTLKNIWEEDIYDYMYEDQAFLGLIEKDTSWDGLYDYVTVQYGGMNGRSAVFDKAQANKSPLIYGQMSMLTRDNFALWSVDHKLITLSRNKRGALVTSLAENTEKAMSKLKRSSCWSLWRNGGGAIGRIASVSTNTITLVDPNDIRNFDLGDVCEFANDDGYYATAGVLSGTLYVTALNEDTGVITFNANISSISGLGTNDYIFIEGDYNKIFLGVPAYVTLGDPGEVLSWGTEPASIWGMARSAHPSRLAGSRFTGSSLLLTESLKAALAAAFRRNLKITHVFAPPELYNEIEMSLQGQKRYESEKVGSVGYEALVFTMQGGKSVKVYSDADIPKSPDGAKQYIWGLNMDTWKFKTADEYPMWLNTVANGGQRMMVEQNANATEGRLGGYGMPFTYAAGQNFNLEIS